MDRNALPHSFSKSIGSVTSTSSRLREVCATAALHPLTHLTIDAARSPQCAVQRHNSPPTSSALQPGQSAATFAGQAVVHSFAVTSFLLPMLAMSAFLHPLGPSSAAITTIPAIRLTMWAARATNVVALCLIAAHCLLIFLLSSSSSNLTATKALISNGLLVLWSSLIVLQNSQLCTYVTHIHVVEFAPSLPLWCCSLATP